MQNHSEIAEFLWKIADLIKDDYDAKDYEDVILPFTLLRRLDCVLLPTRQVVRDAAEKYKSIPTETRNSLLMKAAGQRFYNTSEYSLDELIKRPADLAQNFGAYRRDTPSNHHERQSPFAACKSVQMLSCLFLRQYSGAFLPVKRRYQKAGYRVNKYLILLIFFSKADLFISEAEWCNGGSSTGGRVTVAAFREVTKIVTLEALHSNGPDLHRASPWGRSPHGGIVVSG